MVHRNVLYDIFEAVISYINRPLNVHHRIQRITEIVSSYNLNTYITSLDCVVKVYKEVRIAEVSTLKLYKNPTFSSTLWVVKGSVVESWLVLRQSSIPNSGLGVFAARCFKANEFITCYLGVVTDCTDGEYTFKKIDGMPQPFPSFTANGECNICKDGPLLVSDYWFAHRIQHGSGPKVNVKVSEQYIIISLRQITEGEELFLDYNRDCECERDHVWCKFHLPSFRKNVLCSLCGQATKLYKSCSVCDKYYLCLNCYDAHQI